MKFYNFVMFLLTCFCIGIIVFGLTGCAGIDQLQYEQDKAESEYRKSLQKSKGNKRDELLYETVEERSYYEEIIRCEQYMKRVNPGTPEETLQFNVDGCEVEKVQRIHATPIEMPKEWLDQWPSLRDTSDK